MIEVEQVLVVPREVLDRAGAFQGICFDTERYLDAFFTPGTPRFIPRPQAEQDPAFKQIIPYVILSDGRRFATYVRGKRAGEQRLVGCRSLGIGGHINPQDDLPLFSDFRKTYEAAVDREVVEEVIVEGQHTDRIVALLNDDSTEVGRVHLGIVHFWLFPALSFRKREQVITQFTFMNSAEMRGAYESFETWSQFCVDHIERIAGEALPSSAARCRPAAP